MSFSPYRCTSLFRPLIVLFLQIAGNSTNEYVWKAVWEFTAKTETKLNSSFGPEYAFITDNFDTSQLGHIERSQRTYDS